MPPQLLGLHQVAQHLLGEAAGEAQPHLLHHGPFQPGRPLCQQPVPQVQPDTAARQGRLGPVDNGPATTGTGPAEPRSPGPMSPSLPRARQGQHSPVEVLEGVGELQAAEDHEGLQDLLQLPCAAHGPVQLLHLPVQVAGKPLAHLQRNGTAVWDGAAAGGQGTGRSPGASEGEM